MIALSLNFISEVSLKYRMKLSDQKLPYEMLPTEFLMPLGLGTRK